MNSSQVCKLNFPLYCCESLGDESFLVAGGGGAAKTGVKNSIQILSLQKDRKGNVIAEPVHEFETGTHAVMKLAVSSQDQNQKQFKLTIALGTKCELYDVIKISPSINDKSQASNEGLRNRKNSEGNKTKKEDLQKIDNYKFELKSEYFIPDKEKVSPSSVSLSPKGDLLAVGTSNGNILLWNTTDHSLIFEANGHKDDVTDLDFSPDSTKLVTVSRDCTACLWDTEKGYKINDLHSIWNMSVVTRRLRFRNCRFMMLPTSREGFRSSSNFNLFTTHEPAKRSLPSNKNSSKSFITKWSQSDQSKNGSLKVSILQQTGFDTISALAVSGNGIYLSVGFMDGSVEIYIAFSLQCVQRISAAHTIFVTSMSMVPDVPVVRQITGNCEARCVSVSANGFCHVATLKPRATFTIWFLILIILLLFGILGFVLYQSNQSFI